MSKSYGQFCPVAQAAEIVAERWTLLVIRELLAGSCRFNDLKRGVPLMSPSLLSRRLQSLVDAGLVERDGKGEYHLTEAGMAFWPVMEELGAWCKRWVRTSVHPEELDPRLLMWDIHRRLHLDRFPEGRTVLRFELTDMPAKKRFYWLIVEQEMVDVCLKDPGYEVDLYITSELRPLTEVWTGHRVLEQALRNETIKLHGPSHLTTQFPSWLMLAVFADYPGGRAGTCQ